LIAELRARLARDQLMVVRVAADLVTALRDLAHQSRMCLRHQAHDEERRLHVRLVEHIEEAVRRPHDGVRRRAELAADPAEEDLVPVLQIDGERVVRHACPSAESASRRSYAFTMRAKTACSSNSARAFARARSPMCARFSGSVSSSRMASARGWGSRAGTR